MLRRFAFAVLPLIGLAFLTGRPAPAAENVLKLVPESSLGVAVVNQPAALDAKLQKLGGQLQLPLPSLLAKLKEKGGIQEGLDEKGTVALVVLPPPQGSMIPAPILLVPVTDFDKFVGQLKPEKTDAGVIKIELGGRSCWARSLGGYAAITDPEHREVLEKDLKAADAAPAELAPWSGWLAERDAAVVILSPGVKLISAQVQGGIQMLKANLAQAGEQAKAAEPIFDLYAQIFQATGREVSAFGIGAQLDDQGALRLAKRARLVPGGQWARCLADVKPAKENPLAGLPDEPFVVAGGGLIPRGMMDAMMAFSFNLMKNMPNLYGLNEEQIKAMQQMSFESMKDVRGMSAVLGAGQAGESIYARMVIVMRVENAQKFMAGYEKTLKEYSEVVKKANSPILQPIETAQTQINGVSALEVKTKAPQLPAGQQTPPMEQMMKNLFGPDGTLTAWAAPAGEHAVVVGYVTKEPLERTLQAIQKDRPGLAGDADVSKTAAMLPAGAPWTAYVSPKEVVDFVNRLLPTLMPAGETNKPKLPEIAQTPPIGLAVTTRQNELDAMMAVPGEVFKAIGQSIRQARSK